MSTINSPLYLADSFSGMDLAAHFVDGVHPNMKGAQVVARSIGKTLFPVLQSAFGVSVDESRLPELESEGGGIPFNPTVGNSGIPDAVEPSKSSKEYGEHQGAVALAAVHNKQDVGGLSQKEIARREALMRDRTAFERAQEIKEKQNLIKMGDQLSEMGKDQEDGDDVRVANIGSRVPVNHAESAQDDQGSNAESSSTTTRELPIASSGAATSPNPVNPTAGKMTDKTLEGGSDSASSITGPGLQGAKEQHAGGSQDGADNVARPGKNGQITKASSELGGGEGSSKVPSTSSTDAAGTGKKEADVQASAGDAKPEETESVKGSGGEIAAVSTKSSTSDTKPSSAKGGSLQDADGNEKVESGAGNGQAPDASADSKTVKEGGGLGPSLAGNSKTSDGEAKASKDGSTEGASGISENHAVSGRGAGTEGRSLGTSATAEGKSRAGSQDDQSNTVASASGAEEKSRAGGAEDGTEADAEDAKGKAKERKSDGAISAADATSTGGSVRSEQISGDADKAKDEEGKSEKAKAVSDAAESEKRTSVTADAREMSMKRSEVEGGEKDVEKETEKGRKEEGEEGKEDSAAETAQDVKKRDDKVGEEEDGDEKDGDKGGQEMERKGKGNEEREEEGKEDEEQEEEGGTEKDSK